MAKHRNSRPKSKPPVAAKLAAPQRVELEAQLPVVAPAPALALPDRLPTHEEIARRAYELWLHRGTPNGSQLEDWLSAERELRTHAA